MIGGMIRPGATCPALRPMSLPQFVAVSFSRRPPGVPLMLRNFTPGRKKFGQGLVCAGQPDPSGGHLPIATNMNKYTCYCSLNSFTLISFMPPRKMSGMMISLFVLSLASVQDWVSADEVKESQHGQFM